MHKKAKGLDYSDIERLAFTLTEVVASTSYGTPALKVRGKLMARLREDGETLVLRATWEEREQLMALHPDIFFLTDHYRPYDWVLMRLASARHDLVPYWLESAWRGVAPASLLRKRANASPAPQAALTPAPARHSSAQAAAEITSSRKPSRVPAARTPELTAGYSGTPLAGKLGIVEGSRVLMIDAPAEFVSLLEPLPASVRFDRRISAKTDIAIIFAAAAAALATRIADLRVRIRADASIWVAWPKKAAKRPTDITEDVVRRLALPLGLVDVKVCAINAVWSGLKLVIRKERR